ncbi:MAG TPA: DDE transposase, partial [Candidatus Faecousia faecavium]|nr:DDE transposase [Candidatus Faecousia faecavium]HIR32011.1 DDE transposase [Candidatus Faecousia faecavium]
KLQAYLDEYCFRFNRRMTGDQIFLRLTRAVATSCGVLS